MSSGSEKPRARGGAIADARQAESALTNQTRTLGESDPVLAERIREYEATAGKGKAVRAPGLEALLSRVAELAEGVPAGDRRARQRFIRSLGTRAWISGETLPRLASVWGRKVSTIEVDASVAWGAIVVAADEDDRAIFWAEAHRNLEAATSARESILEVLEQVPVRNAADLRSMGEAARASIGAVDQGLVTIGRASGALSSDAAAVKVSVILDRQGNLKPEIASLLEVIRGALEPWPEAMAAVADALDVWVRDAAAERMAEL